MSKPVTPTAAPNFNFQTAVHQPFSWFSKEAKDYPMAEFVGLTIDVCNGIQTCLELINTSDLDRQAAEDGGDVTPAINTQDSSYLLRLAIATSKLMSHEAERRIAWINEYGPRKLEAERQAHERKNDDASNQ